VLLDAGDGKDKDSKEKLARDKATAEQSRLLRGMASPLILESGFLGSSPHDASKLARRLFTDAHRVIETSVVVPPPRLHISLCEIARIAIAKLGESWPVVLNEAARTDPGQWSELQSVAAALNGTHREDSFGLATLAGWTHGIPLAVVVKAMIQARQEVAREFSIPLDEPDPVFWPELAAELAGLA
jgi:hypothetical protein